VVVLGRLAAPTLPVALAVTAVATAVLVRTGGGVLQIPEYFPALSRLRGVRWLVADRGRGS
jgi:hypothetical protein